MKITDAIGKTEKGNLYEPRAAKITGIEREDYEIRTLRLRMEGGNGLKFMPGQFMQVSVPGVGEMPISPSSSPFRAGGFEISVRKLGNVSNALFRMQKGDEIGIRGPYGNGYPVKKFKGKDIAIVAGGVGIAPLASLVEYLASKRREYGKVFFLYGARTPHDLIFMDRFGAWKRNGVEVLITVDRGDEGWDGNVGVVTTLFERYNITGDIGLTCGPPVMMKFVVDNFRRIGIKDRNIYLSLERLMQCGVGKCGHCNISEKYVCKDGPVFSAEDMKGLLENAWR